MKTKITILLVVFCMTTLFSQVVESEISLRNKKGQISIIKFNETKISDEPQSINIFLKSLFNSEKVVEFKSNRKAYVDRLGFKSIKLHQYYKGVKVEFAVFNVVSKNGNLKSTNGEYVKINNLNPVAKLTEQQALQYALNYISAETYLWDNSEMEQMLKKEKKDLNATYYPKGELVILKKNKYTKNSVPTLSYRFGIYATNPFSSKNYYVDANTGAIIFEYSLTNHGRGIATTRYSGDRVIETELKGGKYRLRDQTRGKGIHTFNMHGGSSYVNATDLYDNNNRWTDTEYNNRNKDNALLDVHWGSMRTYDYFLQIHNRNGIDSLGFLLKNYVNADIPEIISQLSDSDNAFWDPILKVVTYGKGTFLGPYVTLDIVAHEIAHGFQTYSSKLILLGESNAINEGLSDIWAAMVENFSNTNKDIYLLGSELGKVVRSMSNPNDSGNPDTYKGEKWSYSGNSEHRNSTIISHMFYLLAEGSANTDGVNDNGDTYNFVGIGKNKAEQIMYRAQHYFLPETDFTKARNLTIMAAENIYGINSIEAITVNSAWYAVGIGSDGSTYRIEGDDIVCSNSNATFTIRNNLNNSHVDWQFSSNLQFVQSTNYSITVKPLSYMSGPGSVTANINNEPFTKDFWVGKPSNPTSLLGPSLVQYGAIVNYTGSAVQGATSYRWYLPYPFDPNATATVDPSEWGILYGGTSRYVTTIAGPNNGFVQFMGKNKCGITTAKIINVSVGSSTGDGIPLGGGKMPVSTFGSTNLNEEIIIFPNPANNKINIILGMNKRSDITLFDVNSRLIYSKKSSEKRDVIDISNLSNGIYFVRVIGERSTIKKIIVQH